MVQATAIVLAGGKSTRMGRNKALVRIRESKMLEGIIRALADEFPEIIISANDNSFDHLQIKTVPDIFPGCGPLGGIYAGLRASGHHVNFVVACDMPFLDVRLAAYLTELAAGYDAVVPRLGEYYQPLFAVYTKNCLKAVENHLKTGPHKVASFYPEVKTRFLSPEEIKKYGDPARIFFNVNTPGDLDLAKAMAGREENGPAL